MIKREAIILLKEEAQNWIDQNKALFIEISDKIWEYSEIGMKEFKSSKLLADELEQAGFKVERGVAGFPTAFVASYGSGMPVLGIMGEYDALPGLSQKAVPYKESVEDGAPGHGCGHNIHGTSGIAAAMAVKYVMQTEKIPGTIKFFGCPAEENSSGKVFMVREGIFSDVDAVLSHHPKSTNLAPLINKNALNSVKFHFYGKAAHAADSPSDGRSAGDAVELMNIGVNYMREHILQEARIHYVVEDGGYAPNVIPSYARSWYYIRAPERAQVEQIYQWVLDIAKGADLMAQTTHKVEFLSGCYNTIPNKCLSRLVTKNMREIGAPKYTEKELTWSAELNKSRTAQQKQEWLLRSKRPNWEKQMDVLMDRSIPDPWDEGEKDGSSTDVGDVSWNVPTLEFHTATCTIGTPLHTWQFAAICGTSIGHKSLLFGAKTITLSMLDLFTHPELLKEAQEEFLKRTDGKEYQSPLPPDLKPPLD